MRAAFPAAPEEADTEVCEDGTACHWLASEVWEGRTRQEGTLAPNNRVLTDEMFDAVDLYHEVLRAPEWSAGETYCEKQQDCSIIYPGMQGTPDAFTVIPGRLRVVDLKFGFRFVEVWGNLQLIIYAVSIAQKLQLPLTTKVELVIVQPRSYHRDGFVRTWNTTLGDLHRDYLPVLREAAARAMQPNPLCTPNPGCVDCAGRHACVALQNAALSALETSYGSVPLELTAEALGDELRRLEYAAKKLESRITGLRTQAESTLRNGGIVPHYELATTYAREGWREGGAEKIIALGQLLGKQTHKPLTAITPAQARKHLPSDMVAMYAHKPSTGVRLKQVDPNAAKKKFGANPLPLIGDNSNAT